MSYLPPDNMREEYCELVHKTNPTFNQRLLMREIQREYSMWCRDAESVWKQQAEKEAKRHAR